ncbi:DNA replication/repair protein RecF [Candidatus Viridilinea mediisalina]|uniref:DNA replication and repair protein RecF n=1 Tax=Candidatus Viridilinea mediisalina TaxID=2024553 RepID=A0A2A6RLM2_9CHLR|nr:DNA replication/repair protein RecF [Candidatus Viridilinea mediisalina]PDW03962.1 DNA replication/repair protein RecF [Candidatus Viridilinea mediisalina]
MDVSHLTLRDFRNYQRLELGLTPAITLLYGPNAAGKTSILEALFFLATTRSTRVSADRDLVRWDALGEAGVPPFARMLAEVQRKSGPLRLEVLVQRRTDEDGQLTAASSKLVRIDRRPARAIDLVGQLRVVLFTPADLVLVDGPPNERRRYLDITLSQLDPHYVRTLAHYQKIAQQRNSLLRAWRERRRPLRAVDDELAYWDQELTAAGGYLLAERLRAVHELNALVGPLYQQISGGSAPLLVAYQPSLELETNQNAGGLANQLAAGLRAARRDEVARGQTLLGPHRDDLVFRVDGVNLGRYGSRGQQRSVALALKLGEAELMRQRAGDAPVLLLDDMLSELDAQRRAHLLETIRRPNQQTLLTATDLGIFGAEFLANITRLRVEEGRVYPS